MPNTRHALGALGAELHGRFSATLQSMADDCRDDPEFAGQVDADPRFVFASRGLPLPEDTNVRVVRNTAEVFHLAMPPNPNASLSDTMLQGVSGGSHGHLDGVANSASTASTIPSCLGTYGCATGN